MQHHALITTLSTLLLLSLAAPSRAAGPYVEKTFTGRIAYSADGNHNDPDDWAASPLSLAIFAAAGLKDRVVHFDYNCILPLTNPEWEKKHADSVLGAAERYGYDQSLFYDCRKDLDGAVDSITKVINESSAENPLYLIVAGPMQVPVQGIEKTDPQKRKHVFCISHSSWNDGLAETYKFTHTKRDVIATGVNWVQIQDQNRLLSFGRYGTPAAAEEFKPYFWMRDSEDPKIKFLWDRMVVSTRPDSSDSGMSYFLVTGDEEATPEKYRRLLVDLVVPTPAESRDQVRLDAENFVDLDGYVLENQPRRTASHGSAVTLKKPQGRISTRLNQPYAADQGTYDVEIRTLDQQDNPSTFTLLINGERQGQPWKTRAGDSWSSHTISSVPLKAGDEVTVETQGAPGKVDYVQLNRQGRAQPSGERNSSTGSGAHSRFTAQGPLDDPDALPGQIIVKGKSPGHLAYNGGGPAFLCGPDNPEEFLFQGKLNNDGTRSGGNQEQTIERMARAGVNAFHCQMFRMQRCNFKKEGDDEHCPFINHDPSQPLNEDVLQQWDGWLSLLEDRGITVDLEFYNDATDVELMGWTLDSDGQLHPDERRWIADIVDRFQHHKNIMWCIEESCNKLPRERTAHFKKIGQLIAEHDEHHHPIVQSFVVPNDPEGDFPEGGVMAHDYAGDPNIRVVTWLHLGPHGNDFEAQHREYLNYLEEDAGEFVVMKNETFHHPKRGPNSRKYMWSCALTGMHCLEAYHHADEGSEEILREDGFLTRFMEQTDHQAMQPHDELRAGSTKWVLANPGHAYIVYTYEYQDGLGVKNLPAGGYELRWLDTINGDEVLQTVTAQAGDALWSKPHSLGNEIALSIKQAKGLAP